MHNIDGTWISYPPLAEHKTLSQKELATLNIKMGKSHRSEKDWDAVKNILLNNCLFTMQPMDKKNADMVCVEGIYSSNNALIAFTSVDDCKEYIFAYELARLGGRFTIGTIPFVSLTQIADKYKTKLYISPFPNREFLAYDGNTRTLHIYILGKI